MSCKVMQKASSLMANKVDMCPVCWEDPDDPPRLHYPKRAIPNTKGELIDGLKALTECAHDHDDLHRYTVTELKHLYGLKAGKKAHKANPLVGISALRKCELAKLCENHGVVLKPTSTKGELSLALRSHWEGQCDLAGRSPVVSTSPHNNDESKLSWDFVSETAESPKSPSGDEQGSVRARVIVEVIDTKHKRF